MKPTANFAAPLAVTTLLIGASLGHAAITLNADVPINTSAAVYTTNDTSASRGIAGTRNLRQSFSLTQDLTVDQIILGLDVGDQNGGLEIRIYEVDDVNAVPFAPAGAAIVDFVAAVAGAANLPSTGGTLEISLSDADQFFLPARSGPLGYAIEVSNNDDTSTIGSWAHSNTGTDLYAAGEYYTESGGQGAANRDFNLSINGVPEPSSVMLVALGGCLLSSRRRR